jgi:hypothetical protein
MKTSVYHKTHGLSGTIKLGQTGEALHFFLPPNTTKLPISGEFGGHHFNGQLELIPRQGIMENDSLDMAVVLVLPFGPQLPLVQQKDPFENHPALQTELISETQKNPLHASEFSVFAEATGSELKTKTAKFDEVPSLSEIAHPATKVNALNPETRAYVDPQSKSFDAQREPVYLTNQEILQRNQFEVTAIDQGVNPSLRQIPSEKELVQAVEGLVQKTFDASAEPNWPSRGSLNENSESKKEVPTESVLSLFSNKQVSKKGEKDKSKTVKPPQPRGAGK